MRYAKIRGLIREKFGTQEAFAAAMNMDPSTLSRKLSGQSDWTRQEMQDTCELLGISIDDVPSYFF